MDEIETEKTSSESVKADIPSEAASERTQPVSCSEINLGDFTRTQGLLKSLRLMLNNQVVIQVEEIASAVSEAGRKFKMGDVEQANLDVGRMYSGFRQKISQWESQARNLEHQMRMKAAKNPRSVSIDTMNRMKSEQTAVRTRIRTTEVQFRRLQQGLDQIFTNLQKLETESREATIASPADFLVQFKAAAIADRPAIIKDWFEIESVLKVLISRDTKAGYTIKFDPKPPLDRLNFLTLTAQVIRLQKLGQVVLFENLESGQDGEMKLKEFVTHVQTGVWLLKSRVSASAAINDRTAKHAKFSGEGPG